MAKLLEHVKRGNETRFNEFCKALNASGQEHIVEMLEGKEVDSCDAVPRDPDDKPLSSESIKKLRSNFNPLIYKINSDVVFLGELESSQVFTEGRIRSLKASYSNV